MPCSTAERQQLFAPLKPVLDTSFWTVVLHYEVARPSTLRFAVHDGTRFIEATGAFRGFPVKGVGDLTFLMRGTAIQALRLDAQHAGICLTDVWIGHPLPAG